MAKQQTAFPIEGTIDNLVFYKSGGNHLVRRRPRPVGKKFYTDPRFARSRNNAELFKKAAQASQLLRRALRLFLLDVSQPNSGYLLGIFNKALGRTRQEGGIFAEGEYSLFKNVDLAKKYQFHSIFRAGYESGMDRNTGQWEVNIPAFIIPDNISVPYGATHFQLSAISVVLDFEKGVHECNSASTPVMPVKGMTDAIKLAPEMSKLSTGVVFSCLCIRYCTDDKEGYYSRANGKGALIILDAKVLRE